jgi:NAD(P)-dependent dehydrogenase (short-subunit alcohol dehydrogenase family)
MKSILITGANSGLGFATAKVLLEKGYEVWLGCRSLKKAREASEKLGGGQPLELDLGSFASIRQAVALLPSTLEALACNAGVSAPPGPARYTREGVEESFGVNHLGHFLLVQLLLEKCGGLKRIAVVSSELHNPQSGAPFGAPDISDLRRLAYPDPEFSKKGLAYISSKLCNILFTYELARRYPCIRINALNPGLIPATGLGRHNGFFMRFMWYYIMPWMGRFIPGMRTAGQSAADLAWLVAEVETTGKYFDGAKEKPSSKESYDEGKARELWVFSEDLVKS